MITFHVKDIVIISHALIPANTSRPRQNGRQSADDNVKRIFMNENYYLLIKIPRKFLLILPRQQFLQIINISLIHIFTFKLVLIGDKQLQINKTSAQHQIWIYIKINSICTVHTHVKNPSLCKTLRRTFCNAWPFSGTNNYI